MCAYPRARRTLTSAWQRHRHTYRADTPAAQGRGDRRPGGVTVPLPPPRLQAWTRTARVPGTGHQWDITDGLGFTGRAAEPRALPPGHGMARAGNGESGFLFPHSRCAPRQCRGCSPAAAQRRRAQNLPARTPREPQLAKSAAAGWDTATQLAQGEGPESTTGGCSTPMVQRAQRAPVSAVKPAPGPACASPSTAVQFSPPFLSANPPAACWNPAAK